MLLGYDQARAACDQSMLRMRFEPGVDIAEKSTIMLLRFYGSSCFEHFEIRALAISDG